MYKLFSHNRRKSSVARRVFFTMGCIMFLHAPLSSHAFAPNPTLANIPPNTALSLGEYKPAGLPGCHLWGSPTPTVYDGSGVVGYSRFTYDSIHNQMLLWGGGHSTTPRTDVDVLDLNQPSLKWQSAYPSTPIADMRLSNYNVATGGWISTGHPAAVHSYDQLTFVPSTGELLYLQNRSSPKSPCINEDELRVQPYTTRGPIWSYNTNTKTWTPIEVTPGGEWSTYTYVATEYDPVSGKVIILGGDGMSVYDPVTRVTSRFEKIRGGNYAQNLVYFPPTDKMYYVMSNGTVYELTLNRGDFAKSTATKMVGVTGTLPPRPLNGATDDGETGWAYDSVNHIIGGGILNGVFYAFDPVTKVWSSSVMQKSPADLPYNIGSLSVTHVLDYDPVDNVFIFITSGGNYKRYTWAYRYGAGSSTTPAPASDTQPPSVPTGLSAGSVSQASATLSWNISTDNVAVTGYRIYRNGSQIATTTSTIYTDTALTSSTAYTYTVAAYDAAGNVSLQSGVVNVTTQSSSTSVPPVASGNCGLITANSTAKTVLAEPVAMAKPSLGVTYNDPVFGSCVTRITESSRHTYSQLQAWNADQSLILLNSNRIIDAQSFQTVHTLQFNWPASGSAPVWSPTDPNVLYYIGSIQSNSVDKDGFNCPNHDRLIKYTLHRSGNITTGTREMLQCFSEYASIDYHAGWQELSDDGRYLGMVGSLPNGGGKQVFAYDVINRQKGVVMDIATTTPSSAKVSVDWVAVSPSGKYMLVQYASNGYWRYAGMESFDRATGKYIGKVSITTGHGDLVRDADGTEYLMQTNASNAYFLGDKHYIIKAKIPIGIALKSDGTIDANATRNTGATTPIMDIGWTNGIHISCRDIRHWGYCVVNTDGNPADKPLQPFEHEVIKLYLDSTLTVPHFERLAHTMTDEPYVAKTPEATCPMIPYWAQSHASLSPDGSKVIFASTWGENCTADAYVLTWGGQIHTPSPSPTPPPVATVNHFKRGSATYPDLQSAIDAALPGDTIDVDAGTYINMYADINKSVTIRGVGGFAHFSSKKDLPNGGGILLTEGGTTIVLDSIELSGATAMDRSGAGIRYRGGLLTVQNSYFHDNENGILGGAYSAGQIMIANSVFDYNGHGVSSGIVQKVTITHSTFKNTNTGHHIKSRALETNILNTLEDDGTVPAGASYDIDIPNGGVVNITCNKVIKNPNRQNTPMITFGEEGNLHPTNSLTVTDSLFLNNVPFSQDSHITGIRNTVSSMTAIVTGNTFVRIPVGYDVTGPATLSGNTDTVANASQRVSCGSIGADLSTPLSVSPLIAAPTVSLSSTPGSIVSGQRATLTWTSNDSSSCAGTGFVASGTSGSAIVSPVVTTTYSITCTGAGGNASQSTTVTVTTPPSIVAQPPITPGVTPSNGESGKKIGGDTSDKKYVIAQSASSVVRGHSLTQSGKKFSKKNRVRLFFQTASGSYASQLLRTNAQGRFSVTFIVTKPRGKYDWYAVDLKTGRKSRTLSYQVR